MKDNAVLPHHAAANAMLSHCLVMHPVNPCFSSLLDLQRKPLSTDMRKMVLNVVRLRGGCVLLFYDRSHQLMYSNAGIHGFLAETLLHFFVKSDIRPFPVLRRSSDETLDLKCVLPAT